MKGRKTLLWLGLAALGTEAFAEAQTTREEQFQLGRLGQAWVSAYSTGRRGRGCMTPTVDRRSAS